MCSADDLSYRCDAVVVGCCQSRTFFLGFDDHASKLQDLKRFLILGQPLLGVKDRAAVIQLDGDCDDDHNR